MGVFAQLDAAYEEHAIAQQRAALAGRWEDAELHHRACLHLLAERIGNEDAHKLPLPPVKVDCDRCAVAYGAAR